MCEDVSACANVVTGVSMGTCSWLVSERRTASLSTVCCSLCYVSDMVSLKKIIDIPRRHVPVARSCSEHLLGFAGCYTAEQADSKASQGVH